MKKSIVWVMMLAVMANATVLTLKNEYVYFSITKDGTLGNKKDFPGIQYDAKGKGNFKKKGDYLQPGIPYEYYALNIDGKLYTVNNAVGIDYNSNRALIKNILIERKGKTKVTVSTEIDSKVELKQSYILSPRKEYIKIDVTLKNIGDYVIKKLYYARGIDPDSDNIGSTSSASSYNYRGLKAYLPKDLVFSESLKTKKPIGLYSNSIIQHNTSVTHPWKDNPIEIMKGLNEAKEDDGTINIAFVVGRLAVGEIKQFTFYYLFGKKIDDVMQDLDPKVGFSEAAPSLINISYKYIDSCKEVESASYVVTNANSKSKVKYYNGFLRFDNIPEGVQIKTKGETFSQERRGSSKVLKYEYGKSYQYTICRDKTYREKDALEIVASIKPRNPKEKMLKGQDRFIIKLIPKPRKITFKIDTDILKIPLSKLESSNPIPINIFANGHKVSAEEYRKFKLDIQANGQGIDGEQIEIGGYPTIQLRPKMLLGLIPMYCLVKTDKKLPVTIVTKQGIFPGDESSATLSVEIVKDMTLWEQCRLLVFAVLSTLLLFWYLLRLYKKDRFCSNQKIEKYRIYDDGEIVRAHAPIKFSKKVNWWQMFMPNRRSWARIDNLLFYATTNCSSVYLAKHTQERIEIDGAKIDDPGKRDEKVFANSKLSITKEEYIIK